MAALTTFIAIAGVAAAIGGTVSARSAAKKQAKRAKKRAKEAAEVAAAPPPLATSGATTALARSDRDSRRGRGSQAQRNRVASLGQTASSVGGLT
jgi:Flp pilus assembly protein TadB